MIGAVALVIAGAWARLGPDRAATSASRANGQWIAGAVAIVVFAGSQLAERSLHGQLPLS